MIKRVAELEASKKKKEMKQAELKAKIDVLDKRNLARHEIEGTKREEEIKFLRYQETHLAKFVKAVTDGKA